MKVLTKSNLNIAILNSKSNSNDILIEKNYTVVTDGRMMIRVTKPELNIKEEVKDDKLFPIVLKSRTALKICKDLKGNDYAVTLKNKSLDRVDIKLTHLKDDIQQIFIVDKIPEKYSNCEELVEEYGKKDKVFSIDINPVYLEQICKLAKKLLDDGYTRMTMEFIDDNSPVTFKAKDTDKKQDFLALIMPLSKKGDTTII